MTRLQPSQCPAFASSGPDPTFLVAISVLLLLAPLPAHPGSIPEHPGPIQSTLPSTPTQPNPSANPHLFQGARYDPETGFYYFRHRYYDPSAGRFLQRDPVWDNANAGNWLAFTANNPATRLDPLGLNNTPAPSSPSDPSDLSDLSDLSDSALSQLGAAARGAQQAGLDLEGKVAFKVVPYPDAPEHPSLRLTVRLDACGRPLPTRELAAALGEPPASYILIIEVHQNKLSGHTVWSGSGTVEDIERGETVVAEVAGPRTEVEFEQARKDRPESEYLNDPAFHRALLDAEAKSPGEAAKQIVERLCAEPNRVRVTSDPPNEPQPPPPPSTP